MDAYQEYKYKWLIEHGYTLTQIIRRICECYMELQEDNTDCSEEEIPQLVEERFEEEGFQYDLYACWSEWNKCENEEEVM